VRVSLVDRMPTALPTRPAFEQPDLFGAVA
jgi:hypothetical protein